MLLLLLLSRFSRVRLCATPWTAVHQAPLSLGFSRQEHWSGLPFPSPMHESEKWKWSCSVVSNLATPWTAAHQAPPSMGFSRQEYWSGLPLSHFLRGHLKVCLVSRSWAFTFLLIHVLSLAGNYEQLNSLQWLAFLYPRYILIVKSEYYKGFNPRLVIPTPLSCTRSGKKKKTAPNPISLSILFELFYVECRSTGGGAVRISGNGPAPIHFYFKENGQTYVGTKKPKGDG